MLSIQCETILRYLDPTLHNAAKINVTSQIRGHNRHSEKSAGGIFHFRTVGLRFSQYVHKIERFLDEKKDPVILQDSGTPAMMLLQDVVFPLCN